MLLYTGTKLYLQELIGDEIKRNNLKLQQGLFYYQKPRWVPIFGSNQRNRSIFGPQLFIKIIPIVFLHSRCILIEKKEVACVRFIIEQYFVIHIMFYLKNSSRGEAKSRKKS